jgi:hypothetical protein
MTSIKALFKRSKLRNNEGNLEDYMNTLHTFYFKKYIHLVESWELCLHELDELNSNNYQELMNEFYYEGILYAFEEYVKCLYQ